MQTTRDISSSSLPDTSTSSESTLERFKNKVAEKMRDAASSIRNTRGDMRNQRLSPYAEKASGWLDNSSQYLSRNDIGQIQDDVRTQIRKNPGRSLLIAGAAGLIVGAILRGRR